MADAVAQELVGAVGAVLPVGKPVFGQKVLHLLPGDVQHGTDDIAMDGCDTAKALQSGTTEQVHQDGFGIVVGGVGRGDFAGEGP